MQVLIQRVSQASVCVSNEQIAEIAYGMLVLVGIEQHDCSEIIQKMAQRLLKYRLFSDEQGKMNLNVQQKNGEILLVSQFTLAADTRKGLRPGFSTAAPPDRGLELFNEFVSAVDTLWPGKTATGRFGADMQVQLVNDGPVTFLLTA